jgi:hypothetical protein
LTPLLSTTVPAGNRCHLVAVFETLRIMRRRQCRRPGAH